MKLLSVLPAFLPTTFPTDVAPHGHNLLPMMPVSGLVLDLPATFCNTVGTVVMGWWLDLVISEVFSYFKDSMIV